MIILRSPRSQIFIFRLNWFIEATAWSTRILLWTVGVKNIVRAKEKVLARPSYSPKSSPWSLIFLRWEFKWNILLGHRKFFRILQDSHENLQRGEALSSLTNTFLSSCRCRRWLVLTSKLVPWVLDVSCQGSTWNRETRGRRPPLGFLWGFSQAFLMPLPFQNHPPFPPASLSFWHVRVSLLLLGSCVCGSMCLPLRSLANCNSMLFKKMESKEETICGSSEKWKRVAISNCLQKKKKKKQPFSFGGLVLHVES